MPRVEFDREKAEQLIKDARARQYSDHEMMLADLLEETLGFDLERRTYFEQLNTLKNALIEAHKDDIANHTCEWHVATYDLAVSFDDIPRCRNKVTCLGETPKKGNQYWLCDEHKPQWLEVCAEIELKPGQKEGRVIEPWSKYMSILSEVDDTIDFDNGAVIRKVVPSDEST